MIVGIDASNLRAGGGVTHLVELLRAAAPRAAGIERVRVWGGRQTLAQLPAREWLETIHEPALDGSLLQRTLWQRRRLTKLAREGCSLLFAPGGSAVADFHPFVTMCRNMLPFEKQERARYGWSVNRFRLEVLRLAQSSTFRRADGVIFLTDYASQEVLRQTGKLTAATATIPHGVSDAMRAVPRPQRPLASYDARNPFRLLYVSIVDVYKFQWTVAEAVAALRSRGLPIVIDFIGPTYPAAFQKLQAVLRRLDPAGEFLRYQPALRGDALVQQYKSADAFVFASSCENMPNILLEAMGAGLPIASSARGPMREVLGPEGVYFDPEQVDSIAAALDRLVSDDVLRARIAADAYARASRFSWRECAERTFRFLRDVEQRKRSA